jgi:hypothetical protein
MPKLRLIVLSLALFVTACSGPGVHPDDVLAWRARESSARPEAERGMVDVELKEVERLRAADELASSRKLALAIAAERPNDAEAQLAASRAESDQVFLLPEDDKKSRNLAASSAWHFSVAAWQSGGRTVEFDAQHAWTMGTTTHLQPMGDRAAHARQTLEVAERALAADPENATALATVALVNLRLETLPWIANLMASGLPDSSLAKAEEYARRAVKSVPSRENRLILAKVLVAAEREGEARAELEAALAASPAHPRDHALEPQLRALLAELRD